MSGQVVPLRRRQQSTEGQQAGSASKPSALTAAAPEVAAKGAVGEVARRVRIAALIDHPDFRSRPAHHRGDLKLLKTAFEMGADIAPILVAVIETGWGRSQPFILDGRRRIAAAKAAV